MPQEMPTPAFFNPDNLRKLRLRLRYAYGVTHGLSVLRSPEMQKTTPKGGSIVRISQGNCKKLLENFLAPRPGLEPGTCGLTEQITTEIMPPKLKNPK